MKYKLVDDIFTSVSEELSDYADQGLIDSSKLIKVIKTCNAYLGLDINQEHECILEVDNYKVRLPNDFVALNFAVLSTSKVIDTTPPKGFQIEFVDKACTTKKNGCEVCTCDDECGEFTIFQKCEHQFTEYKNVDLVKITSTSFKHVNHGCFNLNSNSFNEIRIKDGWLYTNFRAGSVYINYVGDMEDSDGNLLVLDHDLINPYYEAACIYHIFRSRYSNHNGDELQRVQFWKQEFKDAERRAILVKNMPEYDELTALFQHNRKQFYNKYVRYFDYCL